MSMSASGAQLAVVILFLAYILYARWRRNQLSLPPGPKRWPFIGNALDMPLEGAALTYASWAKRLNSNIISATVLGTTMIILDTHDVAVELLDKRATKYSSRPPAVMVSDLMGFDSIFALNPNSDGWRERRKLFVRHFRTPSSLDNTGVPEAYEFVHRFLLDLHDTPRELRALTRHMVGSLAISLAYGLPAKGRPDPLLDMIDSTARMISKQFIPGKVPVDVLPILKYLPAWLPGNRLQWIPSPGMGFKRFANSVRWMAVRFKKEPYERAVKAFGTDAVRPSFLSNALTALEAEDTSDEEEKSRKLDAIQDTAATVFVAAGDTTVSAILTFIFALAGRPEIRARIHSELDSRLLECDVNLGKRILRLPTFEDKDKFPILMAALMESQRWAPIAPIGVPHVTTEDDVYQGLFIPKGSVVIANQWSMLNDPIVYGPDVLEFNPDRFLRSKQGSNSGVEINVDVRHPNNIAFGFGRRICPGSHIAQSTLWLTAACVLTLFDFDTPGVGKVNYVNSQGKVDEHFDSGFNCFPKKFNCEFRLRSEEARALMGELRIGIGSDPTA